MNVWRRAFVSAASSSVRFETVDVFSSHKFGGNQLAVVLDEQRRLSDDDMRRIAIEFGFSETTIVLPPKSEANTAWVRIFSKDGATDRRLLQPTGRRPHPKHPSRPIRPQATRCPSPATRTSARRRCSRGAGASSGRKSEGRSCSRRR